MIYLESEWVREIHGERYVRYTEKKEERKENISSKKLEEPPSSMKRMRRRRRRRRTEEEENEGWKRRELMATREMSRIAEDVYNKSPSKKEKEM